MTTVSGLCRLLAFLVPLAACLAWAQHLLRSYVALPPSLAVHFNLSGQPNLWMTPRAFALCTSAVLLVVLGSTAAMAFNLPSTLFAHPLPPPASLATTAGIGLAIGAFFQIVRLARSPGQAGLRWFHILRWPAGLLALQVALAAITLHS